MVNILPQIFINLFYFIIFLGSVFFAFYIPGSVLLRKLQQGFFEKIITSIVVGISLFALQGFIFGFLGMRFLTYIYLVIFFVIWLGRSRSQRLKFDKKLLTYTLSYKKLVILLIFAFGIFGQVQQFFPSGFKFNSGFYIFTPSNDDAFLHTSYINQLVKNFPPNEPGMTGVTIKNYHYLSNLVISELIRIFRLPLFATQYQYMYLLISFLMGATAYVFGKTLKLKNWGIILLVYLQYFMSDVIFLLTFITRGVFDFTIHPLIDGTMLLENPPRAFSFVVLMTLMTLILHWSKKPEMKLGLAVSILAGSLIGFKVHTGIPVLIGMGMVFIILFFQKKWNMLFVPVTSVLVSLMLYLPINAQAGSLVFAPFEMARMFAGQLKLNISNLEMAREIYFDHNNFLQALRMDLIMLFYFIFFQFGISVIGLLPLNTTYFKRNVLLFLFLFSIGLSSLALGTLFIQPVAFADIFNFYLVMDFVLLIFAVISFQKIFYSKIRILKLAIVLIILLFTIPRFVYKTKTFGAYFDPRPVIAREEIQGMEFIKAKTDKNSVVLVLNKGSWDSFYPYVSIFTNREMFLSGQTMLGRHGIDYKTREKVVEQITNEKNPEKLYELFVLNNIDILYMYRGDQHIKVVPSKFRKIFENNYVIIYDVLK